MKPQIPLDIVAHGEIQGGTTALQLPDVPCSFVKLKAGSDNATNVYIGGSDAVTVEDGTTDDTTGYELDAGDVLDWIPISNLNKLWRICDANADDLTYICFRHTPVTS